MSSTGKHEKWKGVILMAKDYSSIAKAVVKLIGGESNVTHFEHCSTRLRF